VSNFAGVGCKLVLRAQVLDAFTAKNGACVSRFRATTSLSLWLRFEMRVLHIYKGDLYGGIESMLSTLARTWKLCPEIEPHFALFFQGRLSGELAAASVPLYQLGPVRGRNIFSVRRARVRLAEILRENRIDVAICHGAWSQALFGSAVQRAGVTQIFWQHDAITRKGWIELLASKIQPDFAISNSGYSRSTLAELYPDAPSCLLYCPIELYDRGVFAARREEVRKQMNTRSDSCVIIQVSRLHPWKGHRLHLRALARLQALPDWECWMVGGPQRPEEVRYMARLQALCRDLGIQSRVRFLGERNDVPELIAASDIHCQPNTGPEAFGLTFIEALAIGLPLVTSKIGGAVEIVDDSCGFLIEPDDPVRLANTLAYLIQNREERSRLGSAGPKRAAQLCAPERQLKQLAGILAELKCKRSNLPFSAGVPDLIRMEGEAYFDERSQT
jgi:glycosyltransferase involved in cell wall biosynthesis